MLAHLQEANDDTSCVPLRLHELVIEADRRRDVVVVVVNFMRLRIVVNLKCTLIEWRSA